MNSSRNEKKILVKDINEETTDLTDVDENNEKHKTLMLEKVACSFSDHTSNPNYVLGYN